MIKLNTDKVVGSGPDYLPENSGLSIVKAREVEVGDILIFINDAPTTAPHGNIPTLRVESIERIGSDYFEKPCVVNPGQPFSVVLHTDEDYVVLRGATK